MWWLITAVVCTIIGFVSAMGIAATVTIDNDSNCRLGSFVGITAFIVVVFYMLANLAVYGETMPYTERERAATFAEAAAYYGLDSGTPYPLSVGDKSISLSGNMTVNGSLFHVSGQAQFQGGTSLLVDFRHNDGTSEILEIPLVNTSFVVIPDNEASTMEITLDNTPWSATGYQVNETFNRSCHASFHFGWWPARCTTSLQSFTVTPSVNEGLAGVLQKVLASCNAGKFVEMRVHESDYDRIVGTTDSTMETETETPTPSPAQR